MESYQMAIKSSLHDARLRIPGRARRNAGGRAKTKNKKHKEEPEKQTTRKVGRTKEP